MRRIHYRYGLVFASAAIPGAVLGALLTYFVPRRTFDLIFGILLVLVSGLVYIKAPQDRPEDGDREVLLSSRQKFIGILISVAVGFVSSFLGIGGGIIHVPALAGILQFPVHIATATSHFILAIVTFVGMIVHVLTGTFQHGVVRTMFLALGVLVGAQGGAFLSSKVKGKMIVRVLAVALALVAVRLLVLSPSE